jgi:hypothetical protein
MDGYLSQVVYGGVLWRACEGEKVKGGSNEAAAGRLWYLFGGACRAAIITVRRGITGADETSMGQSLVQLSNMGAGAERAAAASRPQGRQQKLLDSTVVRISHQITCNIIY